MVRTTGMSRAHGCAGVTMVRTTGMSRAHGCAGATTTSMDAEYAGAIMTYIQGYTD